MRELIEQYPQSALMPRALLLAAKAQAELGAEDLQRKTLERLVRAFPDHACATLAHDELRRQEAPA